MVGERTLKEWLRSEWSRTGLTLKSADTACGVRGAASRKYLSADHLWYAPPGEKFEALAEFANREGRAHGRPYFTSNGATPMKGSDIETSNDSARTLADAINNKHKKRLFAFYAKYANQIAGKQVTCLIARSMRETRANH